MANHWDMRYREHDIVYGYLPNVFLASQLAIKQPGSLYLPCDGEGIGSSSRPSPPGLTPVREDVMDEL